ncbi:MAG: hypothetical protein K2X07_01360 [Caulobacteraceae bacterium]|nr:hypothetical protein [Caulobacteraceae bacterium]
MIRLGLAALAFGALLAGPASAQMLGTLQPSAAGPPSNPEYGGGIPIGSNVDPNRVTVRRDTWASRRRDRQRSDEALASAMPQVREEAVRLAASAAPECNVIDASLRATRASGEKLYEVACEAGPGYLIEASTNGPRAQDCVLQWSAGELARERGEDVDPNQNCGLPDNQYPIDVIAAYGRDAGVDCNVDQAVAMAENLYEIGCADRDGWRLEKRAGQWRATSCWEFGLKADSACRFSSASESKAEWPRFVAGTVISDCVPDAVSWMGDNPGRGSFYEIRCRSGEGLLVQFREGAAERTFSCAEAPRIFRRPCSLTTQPSGGA